MVLIHVHQLGNNSNYLIRNILIKNSNKLSNKLLNLYRRYVSCRFQEKITHLTDNIMLLRSGSAADSQAVSDITKYYLSVHE